MTTPAVHANQDIVIRIPDRVEGCEQDEEWFLIESGDSTRRVRIHDYAELYRVPGLYEALVYDTLQCRSHDRITELLRAVLREGGDPVEDASVLELGAGNGVVGEKLRALGIGHVTGLDLLEEARTAAARDRPEVYDDYVVADLTATNPLAGRVFDGLTVVAALGFGDIPTRAFLRSADLVRPGGWVAMTIKSEFLEPDDETGFGALMRELLNGEWGELEAYQRFQHRIATSGEGIVYAALVWRKLQAFSEELVSLKGAVAPAWTRAPTAAIALPSPS